MAPASVRVGEAKARVRAPPSEAGSSMIRCGNICRRHCKRAGRRGAGSRSIPDTDPRPDDSARARGITGPDSRVCHRIRPVCECATAARRQETPVDIRARLVRARQCERVQQVTRPKVAPVSLCQCVSSLSVLSRPLSVPIPFSPRTHRPRVFVAPSAFQSFCSVAGALVGVVQF